MPTAARRRADDYIAADADFDDEYLTDEDEDSIPERSSAIQSGWDAADRSSERGNREYVQDFKFQDDKNKQLVKFLDSEPFAVYGMHWIERPGKKSWTCLGEDCPLCDGGDKPKRKIAFSIVNLSASPPVVEILTVSPTTMQIFRRYHDDPQSGPLDRMYYALSKTGVGPKAVFNVEKVRPRDLEEEWKITPSDAENIVAQFEPLSPSVISFTPRAKLEEIKREINR